MANHEGCLRECVMQLGDAVWCENVREPYILYLHCCPPSVSLARSAPAYPAASK